jgi:glucose/mannose transport system permease protein
MRSRRDRMTAFLMILPSLLVLGIFVYVFIGQAIATSTTDWGENREQPALAENVVKEYVGTQNYQNLMTDVLNFPFRNAMVNTFFFTLFFVGGCLFVGLTLAILLDQKVFGEGFFRTVFLFPMALSFVVTGTIWRWMLQPKGGINILPTIFGGQPIEFSWLNSRDVWLPFLWQDVPKYLTVFGFLVLGLLTAYYVLKVRLAEKAKRDIAPSRTLPIVIVVGVVILGILTLGGWDAIWLPLDDVATEPLIAPKGFNVALIGIIIAAIWQMSGYTMAMFIAGIRGIPEELREAARVDGCSEIGIYRYIILPQLSPIILSAMIILGHISLKIFDLVFAMAGPDNAQTVVPGLLVYTKGFRQNQFAIASSIAVIMLFFVALIIIPYLWSQLRDSKR